MPSFSVISGADDVRPNDIEQPNPLPLDFEDIFQFIANTPALASRGNDFIECIRGITDQMQFLFREYPSEQERMPQAKQDLQLLLENIAPYLAEYTGEGIEERRFYVLTQGFLAHFPVQPSAQTSFCVSPGFVVLSVILIPALILLSVGADDLDKSRVAYDDDGNGRQLNVTRHYHSEERREYLETRGNNESIAAGILFFIFCCFIYRAYRNSLVATVETSYKIIRMRVVQQLYNNYCRSKNNQAFFRACPHETPRYFYELAAKIYAAKLEMNARNARRDGENQGAIAAIFEAFAKTDKPEGQKFNRMLREASCDHLKICLETLVGIQLSNDGLTLQEGRIFGPGAAFYLLNLINKKLRPSLGLTAWDMIDCTNSEPLGVPIAEYIGGRLVIAEYTGESLVEGTGESLPVYTAQVVTGPFFLRVGEGVVFNPMMSPAGASSPHPSP